MTETMNRDEQRRARIETSSDLIRTDGSVSYSNRAPRAPRRFALPVLVVTVGILAGTAAAVVIDLL